MGQAWNCMQQAAEVILTSADRQPEWFAIAWAYYGAFRSYEDYLQSPRWKAKRQEAIKAAGGRCQLCNACGMLNTHHRTYENLGFETPADLTVLCQSCHERHHHAT